MDRSQSVSNNRASGLPISNYSETTNATNNLGGPERITAKPEVKSVADRPPFFVNGAALKAQTVLEHSAPEYKGPSFVAISNPQAAKLIIAESETQVAQPADDVNSSKYDNFPSFISPSFRRKAYIDLLFLDMEDAYSKKIIGHLCDQFSKNLEVCFDHIRGIFVQKNRLELDILEKKCRDYSAGFKDGQDGIDKDKEKDMPDTFFKVHGGTTGNDYFSKYSQCVAIPTLSTFLEAVISAYKGSTDELIKQIIVENLPIVLMKKAGEMRGDIAHKNMKLHFDRRKDVPFGKKSDAVLFDPVHTYPGWLNLIFPKVKQILLDSFNQASNGNDLLKLRDKNFIAALTGNSDYKITINERNRGLLSLKKNSHYLCEISGLGGSLAGRFQIQLNSSVISRDEIENLRSDAVGIYCFHDFCGDLLLSQSLESIISWNERDGTENLKNRLWNMLALISKYSFFERGQASIAEWFISALAKVHKYKLVFDDAWLADGKRLNLTPDLRALSAFDSNAGMDEFRTQVHLLADRQ